MSRPHLTLPAVLAALATACAVAPAPEPLGSGARSGRDAGPEVPRLLLIALDAVPYATVREVTDPALGDGAAFPTFGGPVPLISTFPSTTSLALAGILDAFGLEKSPGYEHRFFDRKRNRKRGGGPVSYRKLLFPWRKYFDWQSEGVLGKGLKVFHLQKSGRKAIDESLAAFAASDKEVFTVYHDLTDLTGHIQGPDALQPFLRHLDAGLRRLRARPGERPFHTVVYSDHGLAGGEPLRNVRKGIRKALRRDGFRIARSIRGAQDVVFIPYGLVSSFVAFTSPGREVAVAESLAGVEGVDLCAAVEGEAWRVVSRRGDARVSRRTGESGELYAYRPLSGDPLGYRGLFGAAGGAASEDGASFDGGATPDRWRSDAWWFEATRTAPYPDALYRIAQGFELVENPASVICSVADGHMYGAAYTVLGSRISTGPLKWTHGALSSDASLGFVMSDAPGWRAPDVVRFDQALRPWGTEPLATPPP